MIELTQPIWLLLVIPLGVAAWLWPGPSRLLHVWRIIVLALILLAMTAPLLKLPSRAGTVIVIADRSLSMPPDAESRELETISLLGKGMQGQDRLGIVSFGDNTTIERAPDAGQFNAFVNRVVGDGSNLSAAINKALSLLPQDGPSRLIVLSDGKWTGSDPITVAGLAASRSVPIDYRDISRPAAGDVGIESLDAPQRTAPGESFMISAWVRLPVAQTVHYELMRGRTRIASGQRDMASGIGRLLFRDVAQSPGTQRYILHVTAADADPVPENNTAKALVGIDGPRPILYLTNAANPTSGLPALLGAGGLNVQPMSPQDVEWSLDTLSNYAAIAIENVPAADVTQHGMTLLAQWVEQTGSGLMMTGGRQSYGPGGYFKSPLEPILPVSMELRQEHRKFSVAIAVALDRSGSMSMPVGVGKSKMDLADLGTAQVVDLLSPMDELAVVAVDSSSHVIVPMRPVDDPGSIKGQVLRIQSMGGGIFIYEALSTAADLVRSANPQTRHIILFADAMDSEEPGDYKKLVDGLKAEGVTVSVIGLGTEHDVDAGLLKDIAASGDGRIYFTQDAQELPRLFAQDTFVVARSSFVTDPAPVQTTGGLVAVTGRQFSDPPPVGGYNLCYLRDGANLAAVTMDEYRAPLLATWQAGTGRVACYSGEADGKYTGPIADWNELGDLFTSIARWTAGGDVPLPNDMVVRHRIDGGVYHVELHLDPQRPQLDLPATPTVTILHGKVGDTPIADKATMHWASPDSLSVVQPLRSDETALATLDLPGHGTHTLTPVCLPYSPEYQPARPDQGEVSFEQLARATGGKQRIDLAGVWTDLVRQPRLMPIAHWLLIAAVTLFLIEVLERRTGVLSALLSLVTHRKLVRKAKPVAASSTATSPTPGGASTATGKTAAATLAKPSPPASSDQSAPAPGMTDALRQASRRAGKRTGKDD